MSSALAVQTQKYGAIIAFDLLHNRRLIASLIKEKANFVDYSHQRSFESLEAAVEFCAKYIPDKHFPEKAIDLLDQACSRARISQITQLEALTSAESMYEVTRETMAATMAQKTGLPLARLLGPPRDKQQRLAKESPAQVQGGMGNQGTR